jgi:hypothetical protein
MANLLERARGAGRSAVSSAALASMIAANPASAAEAISPAWVTHLRGMSWQVDALLHWRAGTEPNLKIDRAQLMIGGEQRASGLVRFAGAPRATDEFRIDTKASLDALMRQEWAEWDRLNQQRAPVLRSIKGRLAGPATLWRSAYSPRLRCDIVPPQNLSVIYGVEGFYTEDGIRLDFNPLTAPRELNQMCWSLDTRSLLPFPLSFMAVGFDSSSRQDSDITPWRDAQKATDGSFTFSFKLDETAVSSKRINITLRPGCSISIPAQPVTVKASGGVTLAPDVVIRLGARQLEQMAREKGDPETMLYGLTPFNFARDLTFEDSARPAQVGDGVCVSTRPEGWAIRLSGTAQVHIARELRPGSCPFRVTLAHEQRHVRATGDLLREYADRIAQALSDAGLPTRSQEWWAASEEAGTKMINAEIKRIAGPILTEFRRAKHASDLAIDAVDERGLCPQRDWDDIDIRYDRGRGSRVGG